MATLTATRCNPVINAFYHRLLARGKAQNVAMTAAMRKFLTILLGKVVDLWDMTPSPIPVLPRDTALLIMAHQVSVPVLASPTAHAPEAGIGAQTV
jgi:hypothetical protein